jgi:plastocyanin
MKRKVLLAATLLALAFVSGGAVTAADMPAGVEIDHHMFGSGEIHVPVGGQVVWTNHDTAPHTVTADDGAFKSGWIWKGGHFDHTFDKPGRYPYHCSIHKEMHGVVVVG